MFAIYYINVMLVVNRKAESKFKFDNKYPIPDVKYPIME